MSTDPNRQGTSQPEKSAETSMQIRLRMAALGWISEDRITWMGWGLDGTYGYSIWFERWDWHGKVMDRISFGGSTKDFSEIDAVTKRAADLALRAWREFPNSVPRAVNDTLVRDEMVSGFWQNARQHEPPKPKLHGVKSAE